MWSWLRRRSVRRQQDGEVSSQATVQSAQPSKLSESSHPAPPLAADSSPGVPLDDGAARLQPGDPAKARAMARAMAQMLADDDLLAQLPSTMQEALRGLLAKHPTLEQIDHGMTAVRSVGSALGKDALIRVLTENLPEILREWFRTPSWSASRRWLVDHLSEMPKDGPDLLDAAAEQARSAGLDENGVSLLALHAALLREARREGVDATYRAQIGGDAFPTPDDSEPPQDRQVELRAKYDANVSVGKPPYAGVVIRTRGEVNWIVQERQWLTERAGNFETSEQAIDLRGVGFHGAVLSGIDLSAADLSGAYIQDCYFDDHASLRRANLINSQIHDTDFSGANWTYANLSAVWMTNCTFTDADFTLSNLSGAILLSCTFTRTKLTFANLTGAGISGEDWDFFRDVSLAAANLSGAELLIGFKDSDVGSDLRQARMDSTTMLGLSDIDDDDPGKFRFGERARLLDVGWNGAVLANVQWKQLHRKRVHRLGDEANIKRAGAGWKARKARGTALRDAARAYRGLAKALQAQGLDSDARHYRARERKLGRQAMLCSFELVRWGFFSMLNIVSGNGDNPGRALGWYVGVIGTFAAIYWAITNKVFGFITSSSVHLKWYEALVLSISSFHGRGFFPATLTLGDPVALVAAAEAIIGLFIELVFIATFTQRFFAR